MNGSTLPPIASSQKTTGNKWYKVFCVLRFIMWVCKTLFDKAFAAQEMLRISLFAAELHI